MTSDSSVEKCGGANEVSCDWVRLHIFVAGKVNDKARVKLAKGAHPLFRCALSDRCVPHMEEHHDDKSTSRATPSRSRSTSFSNNLFLYLLTTPLPLQ